MIGPSIQHRLTGVLQLFALMIIMSFATSALFLTGQALQHDETELLRSAARRVAESLDRELAEEGSLQRAVESFLAEEPPSDVHIMIRTSDGTLLGATVSEPFREGAAEAEDPGEPSDMTWHHEVVRARCGAIVQASMAPTARRDAILRLARLLLLIALPLILVALILSHWTIARALKPLDELAREAGTVSQGGGRYRLREGFGLREIDELARSFNRLLQSLDEHLDTERRFTAEASHELRTPLTVIGGEIELALSLPGAPANIRECLQRAAEETTQMQNLAEALLLLRRSADRPTDPQSGFEAVNLADALRQARTTILTTCPDRASDLTCELPDEIIVRGQPALLHSSLKNLIDNAVKFTSPGDPIHMEARTDGTFVRVTIEDGGTGIPDDEVPHLFEAFYRGRHARSISPGFGLGLPILKRVLLAHGGDVCLMSSRFGGAGFEMRLPLWTATTSTEPHLNG